MLVRAFLFAFFITTLALELTPKPRGPAGHCQDPMTRGEWGIVTHVLKVSTLKRSAPVTFIVSFKSCNFLFHQTKTYARIMMSNILKGVTALTA